MTVISLTILGAALTGMWDKTGAPLQAPLAVKPFYFRVEPQGCREDQRKIEVRVTLGGTTKRWRLECPTQGEVFLEWERTKPDVSYHKELIRRRP